MNCTGTTASGGRCLRHATQGFTTCAQHRAQAAHARTILAGDLAPDGAITSHQETPARASRKLSAVPDPAPPIDSAQARELLARMKYDGLITQRRDGTYHLRSYGRDVLTALHAITQEGH